MAIGVLFKVINLKTTSYHNPSMCYSELDNFEYLTKILIPSITAKFLNTTSTANHTELLTMLNIAFLTLLVAINHINMSLPKLYLA